MKKKTKRGYYVIIFYTRSRLEGRLALYTVQPPFLVGGFFCRFLLLFRSSATFPFVLQHTNNHHHSYIDSTTVLSDLIFSSLCVSLLIHIQGITSGHLMPMQTRLLWPYVCTPQRAVFETLCNPQVGSP